jgi:hypothetical protein
MRRWNDEEESKLMNTECIICNGPLVPLGQLGAFMHYRCRNCGHDQHAVPEAPDDPEECPRCFGPATPEGSLMMTDRRCEHECHGDESRQDEDAPASGG